MAFTPTIIVLISCLGAFFVIGIASVVHRLYTGPPGIEPGTEIRRGVNDRPSDQQARLEELREIRSRQIWERAREARREQGLPTPNWYPGGEWLFSANASISQEVINGNHATVSRWAIEQNRLAAGLGHIECPNRMGSAYQTIGLTHPREDTTTDTSEDEYGVPIRHDRVRPSPTAPQRAHHIARATHFPAQAATNEEGWELQDLGGVRASSVYSPIDLGEPETAPPTQDLTAPAVAYVQGRMNRGRKPSRVHDMVARLEAANDH